MYEAMLHMDTHKLSSVCAVMARHRWPTPQFDFHQVSNFYQDRATNSNQLHCTAL
jgi:hypothetical protein